MKTNETTEPTEEDKTPGVGSRGFNCGLCGKPVEPRRFSKKCDGWHWHKECWNEFLTGKPQGW